MTKREAEERALIHVNLVFEGRNDSVVIVDEATIRKPYGWVFFYQSRKYMESGNLSDMLAGNGPIVVLDSDASIHELGTAYAVEDELRSFEQRMHLAG
ncbi:MULTISPECIES: YrhB domain-containing protein [unclassified Anaeromyxobacter]|uniref:YrhB domain-containing protein n=1 Tax=unclassified Anaeromyxobacter TaxID=2620896 RepID=UPI001F5A6436|nr:MULTISPECIES: YrhB domain-containing protein [unclassified Anaeromyxobacter]